MDSNKKYTECTTIEEVMQFVDNRIEEKQLTDVVARQVRLLAEEVMNYVVEEVDPDKVNVSCVTSFGESAIRISFKGNLSLNLNDYEGDNISLRILKNNVGRLRVRNGSVRTTISILFKETMGKALKRSTIAFAAAFVIGTFMYKCLPANVSFFATEEIVWPVVSLIMKALQLIAAPVTLLCLTINVANILNISERFPKIRRLEFKYLGSSIYAAIIGIVVALAITPLFSNIVDPTVVGPFEDSSLKLSEAWGAITSMVPDNLIQPIIGSSPAVLVFTGVVFGLAVGLVDRESGKIKDFLEMIKHVFCKILSMIVHLTPFIIFVIVLDLILEFGPMIILIEGALIVTILVAVGVLLLVYTTQLKIGGVNPKEFFYDFKDCFADVLKLGSSVDAVPSTIKYCNKKMPGYNNLIDISIPLGAETNMDGVTLMASLILLVMVLISGHSMSVYQMILLGLMIIFVSIGAPNQPGTLTIVSAVVIPQIGLDASVLATVVLMELIFNRILATLDTVGDVLSTRLEIERLKKNK